MNTHQPSPLPLPQITVAVGGVAQTFTSAYPTLAAAAAALREWPGLARSDFARDLLAAVRSGRCSPRQAAWVHKLATDAATPRQSTPVVDGLDLRRVVDMLNLAAGAGKRWPRITLRTASGRTLRIARAGDRSRLAGGAYLSDGREGGTYYGAIAPDGTVRRARGWTDDVEATMRALAADPAAVAGQHGVAVGWCCFCGRELSTAESRSVGYGPICAEKFGLPWGDTAVADAADAAAKAAL